MTFPTIALAERDAGSPLTQELLGKYFNRDESLRWRTVGLYQQSTSYNTTTNPDTFDLVIIPLYLPRHTQGVKARFTVTRPSNPAYTLQYSISLLGGTGQVDFFDLGTNQYELGLRADGISDNMSGIYMIGTFTGFIGSTITFDSIDAIWFTDDSFSDDYVVKL